MQGNWIFPLWRRLTFPGPKTLLTPAGGIWFHSVWNHTHTADFSFGQVSRVCPTASGQRCLPPWCYGHVSDSSSAWFTGFSWRNFLLGFLWWLGPVGNQRLSSFLWSNNIFKITGSMYNGLWRKCFKSEVLADAFKIWNCVCLECGWHLFHLGQICGPNQFWALGRISG